jgi:uncharacterized repeat protein (TIGR01451 family)
MALLASLTLLAMPTFASANGTIKVKKGGDRVSGVSSITNYATGLSGVRFEYTTSSTKATNPASTGWTAFTNLTDANGEATESVPAGTYYVREKSAAAGFTNYGPVKELAYNQSSSNPSALQPYVAKLEVGNNETVNARPNRTASSNTGDWDQNPTGGWFSTNTLSPFINIRDNQPFPNICGLNLLLVLDRSGSINSYKETYRDAAKSLVDSLSDTPTQISILSFDSSLNSYQGSGTGNSSYTISPRALSDAGQANEDALKTTIDTIYASGLNASTNWDAALQGAAAAEGFSPNSFTGQSAKPDVVVFITDGNPTKNSTDTSGDGNNVDLMNLTAGMASSNLVKNKVARPADGGDPAKMLKVYALGVENVAGSGSINVNNLKAVSGPVFGEDYETPTIAGLKAKLTELAARTCGARVYIRKQLTTDATNQAGWKFTGSSTGGTASYLDDNNATHLTDGGVIQTGVVVTKVPAGGANVTVTENSSGQPITNFALTSKVCRTGSFTGPDVTPTSTTAMGLTVPVQRGSTLYCTFTNAPSAKLQLVKKLVPSTDSGTFNLTTSGPTPLSASGVGHNGGTTPNTGTNVAPGGYTLTETAAAGTDAAQYTMGAPSCVERGTQTAVTPSNGAYNLSADDDVVCTWTNTKKAKVTIKKVTVPTSTAGPFSFTGGLGSFNLNGGGEKVAYVAASSLTVTETEPAAAGYLLDSIACTGGSTTTNVPNRTANITAGSGDVIVCTFTNKKVDAKINVVKSPATQSVYLTAPSNLATYNYAVTNPGTTGLSNVTVSDDKCASVLLVSKNGDSSPGTLDPGDTWNYSCSISAASLFGTTTAPITNTVTASGKDGLNATITDTDSAQTMLLRPAVKVVKGPSSQSVYADGTASYTYTVTNPGNTPLSSVTLTDNKCSAVSAPNTGLDATPTTLDPGDVWSYMCSVSAATLFGSETAPITNTATVNGSSGGHTVSDTDTAVTNLLRPVIKVVKSPATQNVYSDGTASYTYVVTNEGNTPLEPVTVGDDKCSSVVLSSKGGDTSPSQLNPGDIWTYTCSVSAATLFSGGSAPVTNTVTAKGTDPTGQREVTDTDTAVTKLLSPAIKVVKGPSTQAVYADGTASYTYTVTNPGDTPLNPVTISDNKCSPLSAADKTGDTVGTTSTLDPGDTWTYTCSISAATLFSGGNDPVTNTVTVRGEDTVKGREVTDTDTALTKLLRPEIKVVKTPTSQTVSYTGNAVYSYGVTNVGNTPLDTVSVSDDKCPTVTGPNKNGDLTPDTLDDGDEWTFTCTISAATLFGADPDPAATVTNTATATGKDTTKGRTVTDTDTAVTGLKTGRLILGKELAPTDDPGRFELRYDGTPATVNGKQTTHFGDGDQSNPITVLAGESVVVSETAVAPAKLDDYSTTTDCRSSWEDGDPVNVLDDGEVTVRDGETVTCTFTNVKKAKITVEKVVSNPEDGDGPQFGFTSDLPDATFSLRHNESKSQMAATDDGQKYSVTENDPSGIDGGYKLTGIVCTDAEGAPASVTNVDVGERKALITPAPGADVTCVFTNKRIIGLQVVVKNPKTQGVYLDGTAKYTYQVTNTGTSDLTDINIGDDKCPSVTGPDTGADATPTVLNPGETWTYTCSISAAALFGGSTAPITNTVTVTAKDELGRSTPPVTDTAVTNLLVPGVALSKTVAPASEAAIAGDPVTFNIAVTNTGNTSFVTVNVSDDLCPANLSGPTKTGDATPATLDPGETWTYTCVVQTTTSQAGSNIINTAGVTATDTGEKSVTAIDNAVITLPVPPTPPPVTGGGEPTPPPVTGEGIKGTSRIASSTSGCVKGKYGTALVKGKNIKRVTFYVNGKKYKRYTKPNSGKNYRLKIRVKKTKYRTYRVVVKVLYVTGATPSSKTMKVQFSRCRPRVTAQPKFTG